MHESHKSCLLSDRIVAFLVQRRHDEKLRFMLLRQYFSSLKLPLLKTDFKKLQAGSCGVG